MKIIILTTISFLFININFAQNNSNFESKVDSKITKVAIRDRKPSKSVNRSDSNVLVKASKILNVDLKKKVRICNK